MLAGVSNLKRFESLRTCNLKENWRDRLAKNVGIAGGRPNMGAYADKPFPDIRGYKVCERPVEIPPKP